MQSSRVYTRDIADKFVAVSVRLRDGGIEFKLRDGVRTKCVYGFGISFIF